MSFNKVSFIAIASIFSLFIIGILWLIIDPVYFDRSGPLVLFYLFAAAPGGFICSKIANSDICGSYFVHVPSYILVSLFYSLIPTLMFGLPVRGLSSNHFLVRHWGILKISYALLFLATILLAIYTLLTADW